MKNTKQNATNEYVPFYGQHPDEQLRILYMCTSEILMSNPQCMWPNNVLDQELIGLLIYNCFRVMDNWCKAATLSVQSTLRDPVFNIIFVLISYHNASLNCQIKSSHILQTPATNSVAILMQMVEFLASRNLAAMEPVVTGIVDDSMKSVIDILSNNEINTNDEAILKSVSSFVADFSKKFALFLHPHAPLFIDFLDIEPAFLRQASISVLANTALFLNESGKPKDKLERDMLMAHVLDQSQDKNVHCRVRVFQSLQASIHCLNHKLFLKATKICVKFLNDKSSLVRKQATLLLIGLISENIFSGEDKTLANFQQLKTTLDAGNATLKTLLCSLPCVNSEETPLSEADADNIIKNDYNLSSDVLTMVECDTEEVTPSFIKPEDTLQSDEEQNLKKQYLLCKFIKANLVFLHLVDSAQGPIRRMFSNGVVSDIDSAIQFYISILPLGITKYLATDLTVLAFTSTDEAIRSKYIDAFKSLFLSVNANATNLVTALIARMRDYLDEVKLVNGASHNLHGAMRWLFAHLLTNDELPAKLPDYMWRNLTTDHLEVLALFGKPAPANVSIESLLEQPGLDLTQYHLICESLRHCGVVKKLSPSHPMYFTSLTILLARANGALTSQWVCCVESLMKCVSVTCDEPDRVYASILQSVAPRFMGSLNGRFLFIQLLSRLLMIKLRLVSL